MCGKVVPHFIYRKTLVLTSSLEVLIIIISLLWTPHLSLLLSYTEDQLVIQHTKNFPPSYSIPPSYTLPRFTPKSTHRIFSDINEDLLSPSTNKRTCTTIYGSSWFYTDFTRPHYKLRFIIRPHLHQKPSSPNPLRHLRHLLFWPWSHNTVDSSFISSFPVTHYTFHFHIPFHTSCSSLLFLLLVVVILLNYFYTQLYCLYF